MLREKKCPANSFSLLRYKFVSETDTELFAHLVEDMKKKHPDLPLDAVVRLALQPVRGFNGVCVQSAPSSVPSYLPLQIKGAFGVCFIFKDSPDLLIGARRGSPLLLGVGDGEYFLASDASAVVEHTNVVEYLQVSSRVRKPPYICSHFSVTL
jgi:glucosamine--fructose-6-phosphate aminotransferase (isomerizing)